jgi:hypothetical protein
MKSPENSQSNIGVAVVVWICTFAAASIVIAEMTKSQGLGLAWGIFVALFSFEIARQSFRSGMVLIGISLMTVFLVGMYTVLR